MLFVFFQYKYLKDRISTNEKNILWIHNSTENIGDSLMKTSSIRYLKSNGYSVDLCVLPILYDLYKNNSYCRNVINLDSLANLAEKYDLIILDSLSSKCMKIKMIWRFWDFILMENYMMQINSRNLQVLHQKKNC